MYKSFTEYNKEYISKYYKKESNSLIKNTKKIELISKGFVLVIPFLFVSILTLLQTFNNFDNSKKLNIVYSESIVDDNILNDVNSKSISNYFLDEIKNKYINTIEAKKISKKFSEDLLETNKIISDEIIAANLKVNQKQMSIKWKKEFTDEKVEFIETLLPLISFQNQQIIIERERLFKIYDHLNNQKTLPKSDLLYLNNLANKYLINSKNKHKIDLVQELLQSVDIIPTSIVLAQAANESGWGRSRFAREYNALFGQYTYDETSGVVPYEREEGKKHLIKNFSSIDKSVESYFKNINTHHAYENFRNVRSKIYKKNLDIKLLTQTLDVYAEDESYVDIINSIIDSNNFTQFDSIDNIFTTS